MTYRGSRGANIFPIASRLAQGLRSIEFIRRPRSALNLSAFQEAMLPRLVRHAFETTPYYRRLMGERGIAPQDVVSAADLSLLPMASKESMREVPAGDLISAPFQKARLHTSRTTGSTGTPFLVRRTWFEDLVQHLFNYRCMREYGLKPADRVLRVRSIGGWRKPLPWRALEAFGLFRQDRLPTTLTPRELADALAAIRPDILTCYTGVLSRVADDLLDQGREPLGCRLVVLGAELSTPRIRGNIQRAFGGEVLDTYSSQEVGLIAWECRDSGLYHVCDDNVILELLKNNGAAPCREGEEGEVVVTSLQALAMPFLRFRLGDVAVRGPSPCPCGAPYATIDAIRGRLQDYFLLPDGREVYPWYLVSQFPLRAPWIRQYDFEQVESGEIVMRVVPLRTPAAEEVEDCRELFRTVLCPEIDVRIELVGDIPPGPGGKFYYHRSRKRSAFRMEDF